MARKTTRLYYGLHQESGSRLYWTMKVKNATKKVVLNGSVLDAMTGLAGISIGCHLSNVGLANKKAFPHPAVYISFTKSIALVITKIVKGQPAHCVRYRHNYSQYVDLNDTDPSKTVVKMHPEFFERPFTLYPYKTQLGGAEKPSGPKEPSTPPAFKMARGELARMKKAGLLMQGI